jgi:hypothetical protein
MDYYIRNLYKKRYKYYFTEHSFIYIYKDEYDYDIIKEDREDLNKEIIEKYYHPKFIYLWIHEIDE